MSRRRTIAVIYGAVALAAAVFFFFVATSHHIYAPGAMHVHFEYGQYFDAVRDDFPRRMRHDVNAVFFVRKLYSVIAFAIVGMLAAPAMPRRRRIALDALAVALVSTAIEIGQKIEGSPEGLRSNFFDIGCGAVGGIIGAAMWNAGTAIVARLTKRRS